MAADPTTRPDTAMLDVDDFINGAVSQPYFGDLHFLFNGVPLEDENRLGAMAWLEKRLEDEDYDWAAVGPFVAFKYRHAYKKCKDLTEMLRTGPAERFERMTRARRVIFDRGQQCKLAREPRESSIAEKEPDENKEDNRAKEKEPAEASGCIKAK